MLSHILELGIQFPIILRGIICHWRPFSWQKLEKNTQYLWNRLRTMLTSDAPYYTANIGTMSAVTSHSASLNFSIVNGTAAAKTQPLLCTTVMIGYNNTDHKDSTAAIASTAAQVWCNSCLLQRNNAARNYLWNDFPETVKFLPGRKYTYNATSTIVTINSNLSFKTMGMKTLQELLQHQ